MRVAHPCQYNDLSLYVCMCVHLIICVCTYICMLACRNDRLCNDYCNNKTDRRAALECAQQSDGQTGSRSFGLVEWFGDYAAAACLLIAAHFYSIFVHTHIRTYVRMYVHIYRIARMYVCAHTYARSWAHVAKVKDVSTAA